MALRSTVKRIGAAIAALLLSALASHAATVRVCNKSAQPVSFALAYIDATSKFVTLGWYSAASGACSPDLFRGSQLSFFVHFSLPGQRPVSLPGQSSLLCVSGRKFEDHYGTHLTADKRLDCASAGLMERRFTRIETPLAGLATIDFHPNATITSSNPTLASQTPNACKRFPNLC